MGRIAPRFRKACERFPVVAEGIVKSNGLKVEEFNRWAFLRRETVYLIDEGVQHLGIFLFIPLKETPPVVAEGIVNSNGLKVEKFNRWTLFS